MKTLLFAMLFGIGNVNDFQPSSADHSLVTPAETAVGSYLLRSSDKTWVKGSIYTKPAETGGIVLTKYDFPGAGRGEFPANTKFTQLSADNKMRISKGYTHKVDISGMGTAYVKM